MVTRRFGCRAPAVLLGFLLAMLAPRPASAFWVLNFSTADTLAPGQVGFIGGTGGQLTTVGEPAKLSYTPFLAHAGIRVGLIDRLDIGYRLVTVPLPYNTAGPSLGAAADAKVRLTPKESRWQVSLIAGGAIAYLRLSGENRTAFSPGGDVVVSRTLATALTVAANARYVFAAIPSAPGGASANQVQVFGGSVALRIGLTQTVSIIPEMGLFRFEGELGNVESDGWGTQYGAVLSALIR